MKATRVDPERVARRAVLVTVPVLALIALGLYARAGIYGGDFHGGMWKAGADLLSGRPLYPHPDWHTVLARGNAFIPPPPLAFLAIPLSVLPFAPAVILMNAVCLAALLAALRVVGVRDRRVYLLAACSLPFAASLGLGQPDGLFALAAALAWRYRDDSRGALATGALIAAKLLAWPLLVWLLITRRFKSAAVAAGVAAGVLAVSWAAIGFNGLAAYPRLLGADARAFEAGSNSVIGAAIWLGAPRGAATVIAICLTVAAGTAIVRASRERDLGWFTAAIVAGLLLSPIMWTHYLAVLFVPLAIARRRLDRVWLLSALFWLAPFNPPSLLQRTITITLLLALAILAGGWGAGVSERRSLLRDRRRPA